MLQSWLIVVAIRYYVRHDFFAKASPWWTSRASTASCRAGARQLAQLTIWAIVFRCMGEFEALGVAVYHSAVNFTSLGYGDIVMSERRRLLGPLEAVNGVLMIGVSTAALMAAFQDAIKTDSQDRRTRQTVRSTSAAKPKVTSSGPWDNPALAKLREWDPVWVEQCLEMSEAPWTSGVLPRKDVELISIAVNAACTNLSAERNSPPHSRRARSRCDPRRDPDDPQDRVPAIDPHCSLGAPILLEEAKAAGVKPAPKERRRRRSATR